MDMYISDDDADKDGEGEAIEMLVEEAVQRGAVHIRTPAACLLEHNLLLQINTQELHARFSLLRATDQQSYDEIVADVNADYTVGTPSSMEPDWLLQELMYQHPDVNAFILREYVEAAHRAHQASRLSLLEEGSRLEAALRGAVHLYGTATAQEMLMLAQQAGATPSAALGEH
jgi:hypothetical protein